MAFHFRPGSHPRQVLKLLLEQGASSTAKDHRGRTPAHCLPLTVVGGPGKKTGKKLRIAGETGKNMEIRGFSGLGERPYFDYFELEPFRKWLFHTVSGFVAISKVQQSCRITIVVANLFIAISIRSAKNGLQTAVKLPWGWFAEISTAGTCLNQTHAFRSAIILSVLMDLQCFVMW